jgi:hypothetical protein
MNAEKILGFDQWSPQRRKMSIWDLQTSIFFAANVLCHEFSHAFIRHHVGKDIFMNDESLAETGFSWENFTFGGAIEAADERSSIGLVPWLSLQRFEEYMSLSAKVDIRHFGKFEHQRHMFIQPQRYGEFLYQRFWVEEQLGVFK